MSNAASKQVSVAPATVGAVDAKLPTPLPVAIPDSVGFSHRLAVDSQGNIFISEYVNNRIRRIDAKTGIITTVAGNGSPHRIDVEM